MKSSKEFFKIILKKQGKFQNLTLIVPFIHTYRHERNYRGNLMTYAHIIVMEEQSKYQTHMVRQEKKM